MPRKFNGQATNCCLCDAYIIYGNQVAVFAVWSVPKHGWGSASHIEIKNFARMFSCAVYANYARGDWTDTIVYTIVMPPAPGYRQLWVMMRSPSVCVWIKVVNRKATVKFINATCLIWHSWCLVKINKYTSMWLTAKTKHLTDIRWKSHKRVRLKDSAA